MITAFVDIDGVLVDTRQVEQGTAAWKRARLGYVSASRIGDVMTGGGGVTRGKYAMRVAAERVSDGSGTESYSNEFMEWGTQQEPFARITYESKSNVFVEKTGFWVHPEIQWLGASPDGLVGDDGLVEIKCPFTTTHMRYVFDDEVPKEYYKQIQCQLWVTGRSWCDFISYDPRITAKHKQLFVKRCMRDEAVISKMESEVKKFLEEVNGIVDKLNKE